MKRFVPMLLSSFAVAATVFVVNVNTASAIKPFGDVFNAHYVKKGGTPEEESLAKAVSTAKCNVCHDSKSKSKKDHNAYGKQLAELLDKAKDKSDKKKILAALETVSKLPSNAEDPNSPTFGDLLLQGKLPAE